MYVSIIKRIEESEAMKIKPEMEQAYRASYDNNRDPYGHAVYTYAERWADLEKEEQDGAVGKA